MSLLSANTNQAVRILELDSSAAVCVEDINGEILLASPGLFTCTTVGFVNL